MFSPLEDSWLHRMRDPTNKLQFQYHQLNIQRVNFFQWQNHTTNLTSWSEVVSEFGIEVDIVGSDFQYDGAELCALSDGECPILRELWVVVIQVNHVYAQGACAR